MQFKVPDHVHRIIELSRTYSGHQAHSEAVDLGLKALDTYSPDLQFDEYSLKCFIAEQEFLFPGFRHLGVRPGRMGGRAQLICNRISIEMFLWAFPSLTDGKSQYWVECAGGMPNSLWNPSACAEVLAFNEVFPECLDKEDVMQHMKWWTDRASFESRLKEIGLNSWEASEAEKVEYYNGIWHPLIRS